MRLNKHYGEQFYKSRNSNTKESSRTILKILFQYFQPESIVDFGCGVGTWLKTGQELGVSKIMGLEGNWLNKSHLVIQENEFLHHDLTSSIELDKQFDLAISLEVAEHIDECYSDIFIRNLTSASDTILFSAAIPGQRGSGHVNEQWPEYWIEKFKALGYLPLDIIRPIIWNNEEIKSWYKQNVLLFVQSDNLEKLPNLQSYYEAERTMWSLVHPDVFKRQIELSDPKYSSFSNIISSLPIVSYNSLKTIIKKIIKW